MSDDKKKGTREYEVGFGKPPKHSQFPPGVSGFKGRRKKRIETFAQIIARVCNEVVMVGGKRMTKFELAVQQVFNQTIKSGRGRDLAILDNLFQKYGVQPEIDLAAEAQAGADEAIRKIFTVFDRTHDIDPEDTKALKQESDAEAKLVMGCSHCGPELRKRWAVPEFKALAKRYGTTGLFQQVEDLRKGPSL